MNTAAESLIQITSMYFAQYTLVLLVHWYSTCIGTGTSVLVLLVLVLVLLVLVLVLLVLVLVMLPLVPALEPFKPQKAMLDSQNSFFASSPLHLYSLHYSKI